MSKTIDGERVIEYIRSVIREYKPIGDGKNAENEFERGVRFAREQDIEIIKRFMEEE